MKAIRSSEISVRLYQIIRLHMFIMNSKQHCVVQSVRSNRNRSLLKVFFALCLYEASSEGHLDLDLHCNTLIKHVYDMFPNGNVRVASLKTISYSGARFPEIRVHSHKSEPPSEMGTGMEA
jgi:hypothetical protein